MQITKQSVKNKEVSSLETPANYLHRLKNGQVYVKLWHQITDSAAEKHAPPWNVNQKKFTPPSNPPSRNTLRLLPRKDAHMELLSLSL